MQYQEIINERGERLWIPLLAGAAIISAPFWFGNKCNGQNCNNQPYYPYYGQYAPYPPYPYPYPYQTYPTYQANYYRR